MMNDEMMEVEETTNAEFDVQLASIYDAFLLNEERITERDKGRLNELLNHPKDGVSIVDYVKIMYMKGKTYEKEDNRNGARYCAMRLLWMQECFIKPRKKRPRYLDMFPYTFEDDVNVFIHKYTSFLEDTYKSINHKLLVISIVLFIIIVGVLFFLLGVTLLLSIVEGFVLCGLNYWLQKRRLPEMFQKNQTNVIENYIEDELRSFDLLYRI